MDIEVKSLGITRAEVYIDGNKVSGVTRIKYGANVGTIQKVIIEVNPDKFSLTGTFDDKQIITTHMPWRKRVLLPVLKRIYWRIIPARKRKISGVEYVKYEKE